MSGHPVSGGSSYSPWHVARVHVSACRAKHVSRRRCWHVARITPCLQVMPGTCHAAAPTNTVFSPTGRGLGFIQRKYHHSNRNFTLNSKMKVPGPDFFVLTSFLIIFIKKKPKTAGRPSRPARPAWPPGPAQPGPAGLARRRCRRRRRRRRRGYFETLFHLISLYFILSRFISPTKAFHNLLRKMLARRSIV